MAGALRVPPLTTAVALALASAIWYGGIAVLAYRVGAHWDALSARIAALGRWAGIGAVVVVLAAVAVVLLRRRRS
jgi:membrane protein DedA with SNARE-associated domain